jgi:hypothetical protein
LEAHGAFDCIHNAAELGQKAIAHQFENAAMVKGDFGFEQFLASGLEALENPSFIPFHQSGVADHVCCKNGCKLSVHDRPFRTCQSHLIARANYITDRAKNGDTNKFLTSMTVCADGDVVSEIRGRVCACVS